MFSAELERQRSIEAGEAPLERSYCFWYIGKTGPTENYEDSIKQIGSFRTVEGFWQIYNHLKRPSNLEEGVADYQLFREGIKPTWEDPTNAKGGKWVFKTPSQLTDTLWEELVLAIIGEQFEDNDEICGAVVSVRANGDIISIWNRSAENSDATNRICDHIRTLWKVPYYVNVDYKVHNPSLVTKAPSVWRSQRVEQQKTTHGAVPPPPLEPKREWSQGERSSSVDYTAQRGGGYRGRDRSRQGSVGGGEGEDKGWHGTSGEWSHHSHQRSGSGPSWGKGRDDWRAAGRDRFVERTAPGNDRGFGDRGFGGSPPDHPPSKALAEKEGAEGGGGEEDDGWETVPKKGHGRTEGAWR